MSRIFLCSLRGYLILLYRASVESSVCGKEKCLGMCWAVMVYFVLLALHFSNTRAFGISPCHFEARLSVFIRQCFIVHISYLGEAGEA